MHSMKCWENMRGLFLSRRSTRQYSQRLNNKKMKSHQNIRLNGKRNCTMMSFSLVTFLTLQWQGLGPQEQQQNGKTVHLSISHILPVKEQNIKMQNKTDSKIKTDYLKFRLQVCVCTCNKLVSIMRVCSRTMGSLSLRQAEIFGIYRVTVLVQRTQRSHITTTTLLRTANSLPTSSSRANTGRYFNISSSCCRHSLPMTDREQDQTQNRYRHILPAGFCVFKVNNQFVNVSDLM